jgi:hypothetical protein
MIFTIDVALDNTHSQNTIKNDCAEKNNFISWFQGLIFLSNKINFSVNIREIN